MVVDPMHFDARSDQYERARPPYPAALWDRLHALGLLGPEVDVLELGAGTGQATERLLETCATVTAVEPGPALARRLRQRLPDATVVEAYAEAAPFRPAAFDLVAAATSVHWLDLDAVLPKVHRALRPGGHLAVWRNTFGDPLAAPTPFRERIQHPIERRTDVPERPDGAGVDTDYWAGRLTAGGWFTTVHTEHFRWSIELTAEQVFDLFSTFSDWTGDEAEEAADMVRDLGGRVTEHYMTPLIVLRRVD
jgi:SAM-dependent methyltransferase